MEINKQAPWQLAWPISKRLFFLWEKQQKQGALLMHHHAALRAFRTSFYVAHFGQIQIYAYHHLDNRFLLPRSRP